MRCQHPATRTLDSPKPSPKPSPHGEGTPRRRLQLKVEVGWCGKQGGGGRGVCLIYLTAPKRLFFLRRLLFFRDGCFSSGLVLQYIMLTLVCPPGTSPRKLGNVPKIPKFSPKVGSTQCTRPWERNHDFRINSEARQEKNSNSQTGNYSNPTNYVLSVSNVRTRSATVNYALNYHK